MFQPLCVNCRSDSNRICLKVRRRNAKILLREKAAKLRREARDRKERERKDLENAIKRAALAETASKAASIFEKRLNDNDWGLHKDWNAKDYDTKWPQEKRDRLKKNIIDAFKKRVTKIVGGDQPMQKVAEKTISISEGKENFDDVTGEKAAKEFFKQKFGICRDPFFQNGAWVGNYDTVEIFDPNESTWPETIDEALKGLEFAGR